MSHFGLCDKGITIFFSELLSKHFFLYVCQVREVSSDILSGFILSFGRDGKLFLHNKELDGSEVVVEGRLVGSGGLQIERVGEEPLLADYGQVESLEVGDQVYQRHSCEDSRIVDLSPEYSVYFHHEQELFEVNFLVVELMSLQAVNDFFGVLVGEPWLQVGHRLLVPFESLCGDLPGVLHDISVCQLCEHFLVLDQRKELFEVHCSRCVCIQYVEKYFSRLAFASFFGLDSLLNRSVGLHESDMRELIIFSNLFAIT